MNTQMSAQSTLQMEIEKIRKELDKAAVADLTSEECFRLSLKLDALLEKYYKASDAYYA